MLKSYIRIAWRNLARHKAYSAINVVGLSLGIACSILIFTVVSYHLSFDQFNAKKERIYRIVTEVHTDNTFYSTGTPSPLARAIRNDFVITEKAVRVALFWKMPVTALSAGGAKKFREENGIGITTADFFDIFDFPLEEGDITTALSEPNTAIITRQLAKKYFGNEDAMGRVIRINNNTNFKITGILKDIPSNTDRKQEIYVSDKNLRDFSDWQANDDAWGGFSSETQTFLLLKPGMKATTVAKIFPQIMTKYYANNANKNVFIFKLQPLRDIHFNADYAGYADKKYLWAAALIGLFLVITACVNFINLATALALNRSKEIGVRKVLGGMRMQLFWQFIIETTLITLLAASLAFGLAQSALPLVNSLFKTQLIINPFTNISLLIFIILTILVVVFLSGSYPGLVLSGFKPITALKGKLSQKSIGGFSLRRGLVVTQFAITQLLIIATIIIVGQMGFSKNTDLGFDKENVVMVPIPASDSLGNVKMNRLRNELAALPSIKEVSFCMEAPGSEHNNLSGISLEGRGKDEPWSVNSKPIDDHYLSTFNLQLVAGRNLYPSNISNQYIVNETVVKKLGFRSPAEIINQNIKVDGITGAVVGVVKDFYNNTFRTEIAPIVMFPASSRYEQCAVRIIAANRTATLGAVQKIWNSVYPEDVYSYEFLDAKLARFYALDDIMLKLVEFFAGIAILIGCLGLYGLVSFMALQKTKEIGVRKVLGAGLENVLWLFGKEICFLLIIAFMIAAPVASLAMSKYLQEFKYRIHIGASVFLLTIAMTFVIALLTVGYRSLKAALANPAKSLRSE